MPARKRRQPPRASTRAQAPAVSRKATPATPSSPTVRIGRLAGAHGLKGGLRLRLDNPASDALHAGSRVMVNIGGTAREYRLVKFEPAAGDLVRIALEGVETRDAAEALAGAAVSVAAGDLPPKAAGEFYYFETVGCEVRLDSGERLGIVTEVFSTGANDVWVVRDGDREVLIPVIEDVVASMDLAARIITIVPVPGLLD